MHPLLSSALPLLALLCAGEGADMNMTGCSDHESWLTAFRPYVALPETEYIKRYDEWIHFCHVTPNVTLFSAEELAAAWNDYTSFLPLTDCFLSPPPTNSGTIFRLCVDITQLLAVVCVFVYFYFQQYVRSRHSADYSRSTQSTTHHRRYWPLWIR